MRIRWRACRALGVVIVVGVSSGASLAQESSPPEPPVAVPAGPQQPIGPVPEDDPSAAYPGRYRITPGDVLEFTFRLVPELNQVVAVQPDGYIVLREAGELRAQGRTVPELHQLVYAAYEPILREPVITIVLKEFEKPFFVVAGQVKTPGKYDLRGTLTVTQAIAVAGGFTSEARTSQVVLFRRFTPELLEVKEVNVKRMLDRRDLSEDYVLRPGDTVLVPKSLFSTLKPFIPTAGLGFYLNPFN